MSKSSLVDLRPNRLLLDPSFGGYKLSLDPISVYRKQVPSGVNVVQPSDDQYSFSHVKIFSLHNHLHTNPHQPHSIYFVGKSLKVVKITIAPHGIFLREIYQIPKITTQKIGNYNITIAFPSPELVLISNGCGVVYIAKIKEHEGEEVWEGLGALVKGTVGCVLLDARIEKKENKSEMHILLLSIEEKAEKENAKARLFHTILTWKIFSEGETVLWNEKAERKLSIDGSVDYAVLEPECTSIYVISDKPPKWLSDSEKPVETAEKEKSSVKPPQKIFSWTQTNEEMTFWLPLANDVKKEEINVSVENLHMEIKVKGEIIISSKFFHRVNKDLTVWTFEQGHLEVQLTKEEEGLMWKTLFPEDERGEEILDPAVVKNIHERLAHLCSDKEEEGAQPSFNTQQLEECDAVSCETTSLVRINGEDHTTTHEVRLSSSPWLFKIWSSPTETPAICCRHDVDACVWRFRKVEGDDKTWPHEHIGTFSAFGYVQASKTQKKFVASPPNLSYVAICEGSHHIYIYRQPSPLSTELKNRHTGKKVDTVSVQQLVNLDSKEQILGVYATNNLLCVLLESMLSILVVNE